MANDYWTRTSLARRIDRRAALKWGTGAAVALLVAAGRGRKSEASDSPLAESAGGALDGPRLEMPDFRVAVRSEMIPPKATDAAIDRALEPHYVAFPLSPARGRLFVFFHSTGNFSDDYQLIVEQAARNGFHAVSLRFVSEGAIVGDLCRGDSSPACATDVRNEQVTGTDSSRHYTVSRANSVENRLTKLLSYLQSRERDDGWDAFLDGGNIRWSTVHAAGHSQGASIAPFLAKDHRLARVAMFAGPGDNSVGLGRRETVDPSVWLLGPHATPSDRYYAFGHSRDTQINLQAQWAAIKLGLEQFGQPVNIDSAVPPFSGSHLLLTDAAAAPPRKPVVLNHGTTIRDDVTPKALDGQPLFAPVWQYMCFS